MCVTTVFGDLSEFLFACMKAKVLFQNEHGLISVLNMTDIITRVANGNEMVLQGTILCVCVEKMVAGFSSLW